MTVNSRNCLIVADSSFLFCAHRVIRAVYCVNIVGICGGQNLGLIKAPGSFLYQPNAKAKESDDPTTY